MGIGRYTDPGAIRPVEHPGWNLQPTVRIGTAQITAKNNTVCPLDRLVNADPKSKPRMPSIQQFLKLGFVGVLKPCCITRSVPTGRSAKRRRLCCSITLAQPARHREQAGKLYPPAIQSSASVHNSRGSNRRWMKVQWQVKTMGHVWTCMDMYGQRPLPSGSPNRWFRKRRGTSTRDLSEG